MFTMSIFNSPWALADFSMRAQIQCPTTKLVSCMVKRCVLKRAKIKRYAELWFPLRGHNNRTLHNTQLS